MVELRVSLKLLKLDGEVHEVVCEFPEGYLSSPDDLWMFRVKPSLAVLIDRVKASE